MRDPIRVILVGTGQMGAGIGRLILSKQGLDLVGAYGRRSGRAGTDFGGAIGLGRNIGLLISNSLADLIEETRPDVAIQATCSRLADAKDEIFTLVGHGVHVISIAEEMACPKHRSPKIAGEIDLLAATCGVSVLGTGINPGFVLDLLVIALTGVCADIDCICAERNNDLSPYGPSVLASQGVGLTPDAFHSGLEDGSVIGHVGFPESIHMITDAIGWQIERIEESREPIVSQVRRETPLVTVEPGQVAGCLHRAIAYRESRAVVTLIHPQQVRPQLEDVQTGDCIEIIGRPSLRLAGSPEIPGGEATIALAVNMIPHVLNAAPGLHMMADLPVPTAILGDARKRLHGVTGITGETR
jgi:4-hydroxy-tetrahydrodipicolinate reductase